MDKLIPIEHKSQRVLTTQQIAEGYGTDTKNIQNNYIRNDERYLLGVHYYKLDGEELQAFKADHQIEDNLKYAPYLFLWTEKGALLHAKSLNTDKAWEVYGMLVETYFRRQLTPQLLIAAALIEAQKMLDQKDEQIQIMAPKADSFDTFMNATGSLSIEETAKTLNIPGVGRNKLFDILTFREILFKSGNSYRAMQTYVNAGYFVHKQVPIKKGDVIEQRTQVFVTPKGLDWLSRKLNKSA